MFGYVTINKPEMKIKDFERYRMYYCGLCQSLKKRYGMTGQISLTYDSTFAAVLLTALYEPATSDCECRCMVHPMSKKNYLRNLAIDYMADMNILLSYYKCLDDWEDDRNLVKLSYSGVIRNKVKKTAKTYRHKAVVIRKKIRELSSYEKAKNTNIDVLAGCFGDIMREIFAVSPNELKGNGEADSNIYKEDWSEKLGEFGFYLGKFIYILDAYDDVKEDVAKDKFNPFTDKYKSMETEQFKGYVKQLLMLVAADMAKAYEKLPIVEEVSILRNVIYSGIWTRFFDDSKAVGKEQTV